MRVAVACAALIALGAQGGQAQVGTGLSGTWERVQASEAQRARTVATRGDAAFETGEMGDGWGWSSPVTITQRSDSLVVEYVFFATYDLQPAIRLAYALDGSESRNTLMIGHASVTQRARVQQRGDTVMIVATYPLPSGIEGTGAGLRQTLTLDANGRLVVETVRAGAAGATDTSRTMYSRR